MYGIGYISRSLVDTLQVGNGLGKPTIKFEFEDNQALADFLTKTKENVDYAETVDADSNPLNVNNRSQSRKAAQQKTLPYAPSNYLPPSDGTPSLPPSPTSPKSLPTASTATTVPPLPSFDAVLKNDLDKSDWNRIGFKVGNVGYINDKLQYLDIYVPRYYDIIENWMKYAEYLYPNFVVALCRTKKDKWIFAFDAKKYSKFLRQFYDNGTKNISFTQRFVFVYDVDFMEQVVKHFNDNGMQVALFYRQVYDGDQPEIITHQKAALPPYVASELPTEPDPQPEPTTPEVEPQLKKETIVDRSSEREHVLKQAQDIIYTDNVETTYLAPDIPVKTFYLDDLLNVSAIVPFFKHKYGNDVLVGNIGGTKKKPVITFVFDDAVKVGKLLKQRVRGNNAYIVIDKNILPSIRKIKDVYDLILYEDHVKGLGKPTIKLEFEDNGELMSLFEPDGVSGMTVNDKPAAVFNCPESELDCQGFKPTYRRLSDYSHLIDAADGAKTLKGYGFEKSTLEELVNACRQYKQVERLAAHLKDPDKLQSAFNIWHWLHTNVRYNYDTPGQEEIRTPARTWADRERGVDCDCLAVFTACLLINMGYNPAFEIVAFNDSPTYSHIYVNLDGVAIDRVLPIFMARPQNITKTKIMEIPVYELSGVGVGRCNTLNGVYSSTLAKIQSGTATGNDLNDFRKTQVLVTLKGIDEDAYKLAALLMPHIATVGDDGKYYFDNAKFAEIATKADAGLSLLKQQGASKEVLQNWLAEVVSDIDIADTTATASDEDTIVVVINPKGCPCRVAGNFTATELQTLTPMAQTATAQDTPAAVTPSPVYATTPYPTVQPEAEKSNTKWWILGGLAAAFGLAAISKKKNGRR